jgi:hypothetical protein
LRQEYRRCKAVGELHSRHAWMLRELGGPSGAAREGDSCGR